METNNFQYPELEESFSFHSYECFSDEDGEDDSSSCYIEIALDEVTTPNPSKESEEGNPKLLCVTSLADKKQLPVSHVKDDLLPSTSISNCRTSLVNDTSSPIPSRLNTPSATNTKTNIDNDKWSLKVRTVAKRLLDGFSSKGMPSAQVTSDRDLGPNRKPSKATRSINSGILKLLIKFRQASMPSMLSSLVMKVKVKPRHCVQRPGSSPSGGRLMKDLPSFLESGGHERSARSRAVDVNLVVAIGGVLEAMTAGIKIGRKPRVENAKSCPTSSFPIHTTVTYARDNSVQAAIAHCKRSSGQ